MNKTTNIEIENRVSGIINMIIEGCSNLEIYNLSKEWNCTRRTIDNYLVRARELIIESNKSNLEFEKNKLLHRYELLFRNSFLNQDYKTCATILNQQSKMFGLDKPEENNKQDNELIFIHKFVGRSEGGIPSNKDILDFTDDNEEMDLRI